MFNELLGEDLAFVAGFCLALGEVFEENFNGLNRPRERLLSLELKDPSVEEVSSIEDRGEFRGEFLDDFFTPAVVLDFPAFGSFGDLPDLKFFVDDIFNQSTYVTDVPANIYVQCSRCKSIWRHISTDQSLTMINKIKET